jgi:disulfide bond formation protein DsbB
MAWTNIIKTILENPLFAGIGIAGFSASALSMALISQYGFGLLPCILCIYQRIPYGVAIVLGLLIVVSRKNQRAPIILTFLSAVTFFINSGIAFFHSGVERLWWDGLKGCGAPDMSGTIEELMERIKNMPQAKCSEIPWADPIIGFSMANYNVIVCFGAGIVCLVSTILLMRKSNGY